MGWRFRRSFRVAKGLRINLSSRGIGVSGGVKGFRVGIGPRGAYRSISIPGTGLYNIEYAKTGARGRARREERAGGASPAARPKADRANIAAPVFHGADAPMPAHATWSGFLLLAGLVLLFVETWLGLGALAAAVAVMMAYRNDPRTAASHALSRARTLYRRGQYERAAREAAACLEKLPTATQAHHIIGSCLVRLGRAAEAVPHFEQVAGDGPAFLLEKAQALAAAGRPAEALETLQRLPPEVLRDLPVRLLHARLLIDADQPDVALEVLRAGPTRRKIEGDPGLLELHYLLGRCYEAAGQAARARREYARVLADTPDYRDAGERLRDVGPASSR